MLVLGLILILLAVGLFLGFLASGNQEVTFDSGVLDLTMNTLTIYLLGALTLLLLVAGLTMMRGGMRKASQRRKEHKELNRLSKKLEAHEAERHDDTADPKSADAAATGAPSTTTEPPARTTETSTAAPEPDTRVDESGSPRGTTDRA